MNSGPKPLFAPDDTNTISSTTQDTKGPKPLDLSTISTQPKATPNPSALFAEDTKSKGVIIKATELANTNFTSLGINLESVQRQIKQLIPLTITNVVTWGEPGVSQESELITKAAVFIKSFSELRGNELCETALNVVSQVKTGGFFQKLMNSGTSVLAYKPNLIVLKSQLTIMLPQVDEFIDKIQKAHIRVSINAAALSSVCDAVGDIQDQSLSIAVDNRRRILAQCVQQCNLTMQQLTQMKGLMVDQFSRASQLLDVTIPAFESAHAVK